jgi:hypothetical protein
MINLQSISPPRLTAKSVFVGLLRRLLLPAVLAVCASSTFGSELGSASLTFESQGLALSKGETVAHSTIGPDLEAADFYFAYHADRSPHATLMPSSGAEISLLSGTGMSEVTVSDVTDAVFSHKAEDLPFDSGSSALLRTANGLVYLIGNASETDVGVSFQYTRVE